ncbi:hypothetical protein, partial [Lactobacillus jensenii]
LIYFKIARTFLFFFEIFLSSMLCLNTTLSKIQDYFLFGKCFLLFSKESVSDHNNRDDLINLHYFLAFGNTF